MFRTNKLVISIVLITAFQVKLTAQTAGPSQPEVQSFQPVSISNMVDKSTGQFQYSIPLFTIGGYPVNVNYNSQVGMENEASMVGLGFNFNPGAITRSLRGLPDDFNGDIVLKRVNMKPNRTWGIDLGLALEFVGFDKDKAKKLNAQFGINLSSNTGLFYNNYTGWGIESSYGAGFSGNKGGFKGNAGIGLTSNSQHGTNINPYVGLSWAYKKKEAETEDIKREKATKYSLKGTRIVPQYPGMGVGLTFNSQSYSPKIDLPFTTYSMDFSVKLGYAGGLTEIGGNVKGYFVTQKLETNTVINPAFGFMYAEQGKYNENALMDFNREKDGLITEETPNLALPYATQDVYNVAGQGIGGSFELKRNNIFIGFDPKTKTNSHAGGIEIEFGAGNGAHIGADIRYGYTQNTSQKWQASKNEILNQLDFIPVKTNNNPTAEEVFFKNPSDVMFNSNPIYGPTTNIPLAPKLKKVPFFGGKTLNKILNYNGGTIQILPTTYTNTARQNRMDAIYYLSAGEASQYGIEKSINNYPLDTFNVSPIALNRVDQYRQSHHISEMICLKADGSRYVFNVPAYNNYTKDVSWSLNDLNDINSDYETTSFPDIANLENKNKGKDDYVSITQTPAYAHSFLLGEVLSPNYIDVDDNGPSINDIGDYIKFNYSRAYQNYYWRSNNSLDRAAASKGNLADKRDGKGFYQEGTKEVWYIHSIESKNEVARFYYSDRSDAYDLKTTSNKLKKLDSICVFSRPELQNANPVPFKRIYFEFENTNTLCKGVNGDLNLGKLTLNKIYFKDGTSNKGRYSAYSFGYANNYNYNTLEVDRWGNYKPNTQTNTSLQLDNKEFPYVNQFAGASNNQYASAWLLNQIKLPSGGTISIDYEAHDYAYVQNKRAMLMSPVVGFAHTVIKSNSGNTVTTIGNELYSLNGGVRISNNFLIFKLNEKIIGTVTPSSADFFIKRNLFTDNNDNEYGNIIDNSSTTYRANLYGKFRVKLNGDYGYEDIPAFMGVRTCGALKLNGEADYNYGYAELEPVAIEKSGASVANPVFKAAGQFIKLNYANMLFGFDDNPGLNGNESAKTIAMVLNPAGKMLNTFMQTSPLKKLLKEDAAKTIDETKSFIRVYESKGFRTGGNGARVKTITINDNWNVMTGNQSPDASYKIQYVYTKKIGSKVISSGVAAYEPELGGDENPFRQPVFYATKNVMMPDDNNYVVTPFGESLFPAPGIVYSEVKTIQNPVSNPNQAGAGYSIDQFYTSYDFPCKVSNTIIELLHKPKVSFSLLKSISHTYMVAAQGYSVTTNDMHGKAKSEEVFGQAGNLISGKYYTYRTNGNELDNKVKNISIDGTIKNDQLLGVETQLYGDARSFFTETFSGDVHGNLDLQVPPPVPAPSIWPDFTYEKKSFNSSVLCKYVRLQGILESVKVVDKGATITTKNILWDDTTGAVLLTQTINEFKDPVYNFTYPAHWAYSGMGMASNNIGASVKTSMFGYQAALAPVLQPGDIIAANNYKYVVQTVSPSSFTTTPLYSTTPAINFTNTILKVITSGKKNLATTSIGSLTTLKNPITGTSLNITAITEVIDANALEFSNITALKCDTCNRIRGNNYLLTNLSLQKLAPWQQLATYKFVSDRIQNNSNPGLRKDGSIALFVPFWNNPATGGLTWSRTSNANWQFTSRLSYIDNKTNPVESYNPLNIFSSGQPSNIHGQTYAVTNNARYFENFFESFEEQRDNCNSNHLQVPVFNSPMLDNTTAHTGYYSMKVPTIGFEQVLLPYTLTTEKAMDPAIVKECAIQTLVLIPGKKYIFAAWVKQRNADQTTLDYTQADVSIIPTGVAGAVTCSPKGQIIDGWQHMELEFTAPSAPNGTFSGLKIKYAPNCNYDDIRIYPADAMMKSYIFSNRDYSLMAVLDENNFATFYEYDQQKQLKRVKKETEKGIVTIQEVNFGSFKQ